MKIEHHENTLALQHQRKTVNGQLLDLGHPVQRPVVSVYKGDKEKYYKEHKMGEILVE